MAGDMKTAPLITKKSSPVDRMIKKKLLRLQLCCCSVYTTSQECKSSARLSLSAFFPPCRNNFAQMQNLPHSSESPKILEKPCFATFKCQFFHPFENSLPMTPFENQRIGKSC